MTELAAVKDTPAEDAAGKNESLTEYTVLHYVENGWQVLDPAVHARNADKAIRHVAKPEGRYVAVPSKSWQPRTVRTETTTKTVLE